MPARTVVPNSLVGARLVELREMRGLAQAKLADLAGVGRSSLWRVEKGKMRLTPRMAHRLALGMGMAPSELLALCAKQDMLELEPSTIDRLLVKTSADLAQTERRRALLRYAENIKATDADLVWLLRHYDKDRS